MADKKLKKAKKLTALVRDLEKSLDFGFSVECPWMSQYTTRSQGGGDQCTCAET